MGINHLAFAVRDMAATHRFYTESMGFDLVKTEIVPKPEGFVRHVFYSTGSTDDQLIAFWDLSNVPGHEDIRTDISRDLGLEPFVNHLAFTAADLDDIALRRRRWLDHGHTVLEIDHGWITSIYTEDPDGIAVEFAVMTRALTEEDATEALALLRDPSPPPAGDRPMVTVHRPDGSSVPIDASA